MGNMGSLVGTERGSRYEDRCLSRERIEAIRYQPGTAVKLRLAGREGHRVTVMGWIEGNYKHHILVRVDTVKGPYNVSINKIDLANKEVIIREVN